jgi:predicted DNA-binding WGR domain protein
MKEYFEYSDSTFWAIRTQGNDFITSEGSIYCNFWPELMLKVGTEEGKYWVKPPNAKRTSFSDDARAETEAIKMAEEKIAGSLVKDDDFWHIAIELNAHLLFFVPTESITKELCTLAAKRDGRVLKYVPVEMQDQ